MLDSYSAIHAFTATALAGEMNDYVQLSNKLTEQSKLRDLRGNSPVLTNSDRTALFEMRIKLAILAAAYVEGLANFYLSLKLDAAQFEKLERKSLIRKWADVPTSFLPSYSFPKTDQLYKDLDTLVEYRNWYMHSKPEVSIDGVLRHRGNQPQLFEIHKYVRAWDDLPSRLVDHVGKYDDSLTYSQFKVASAVDEYTAARAEHTFI